MGPLPSSSGSCSSRCRTAFSGAPSPCRTTTAKPAPRKIVANDADRKGGHLLPAAGERLYGIDHGVTFNAENKLRTLLWGWAGEPLTAEALAVLDALGQALKDGGSLAARLAALITAAELDATRARVEALLASGKHPEPSGEWPAIPWPPV
ncbi:hypothetical protein STENM223S_01534 [Streptomyces tendae]